VAYNGKPELKLHHDRPSFHIAAGAAGWTLTRTAGWTLIASQRAYTSMWHLLAGGVR
jgi:hypothetical protein